MKLSVTHVAPRLTVRAKMLALLIGIVAAVALPQICHVAGRAWNIGTGLGELLLPMHLPILAVGLLAGPAVGATAGLAAPAVSFLLSGMPLVTVLPFMCVELCFYGLCAGALRRVQLPIVAMVLVAQLAGRMARMLAILIGRALGGTALTAVSTWIAVKNGLPGLAIQWILIPVLVLLVEKAQKNES